MPEMTFTVRWPDGETEVLYSPSLVVHDHLHRGTVYTVEDFTSRSVEAMAAASERVRQRYGVACTSAAATADRVRFAATCFAPGDPVQVLDLHPPLPTSNGRRS